MCVKPQNNDMLGVKSEAHPQQFGVAVVITPWNSPSIILVWKRAPAFAAGNTVVMKYSEMASESALEFACVAQEAGLAAGVLNVATGYGHEVGEALVRHPLTRKVTFTGSGFGGRKVSQAAASQTVPTTLELGGKSAKLVFFNTDVDNAEASCRAFSHLTDRPAWRVRG